jgi:hypothetical protein
MVDAELASSAAPARAPGTRLRSVAAALALLCLLVAVQRLRTYGEPFERDIMIYAVIGHELLHGAHLYVDVLDHKPPAVYVTFAAAEAIVGYGPQTIYVIGVVCSCLTLLGLFACGASSRLATGFLAALLWLLCSYDLNLQANQPNTEATINATLALAFALLLWSHRWRRPTLAVALAGALVALSSLYKPVTLLVVPLWLVAFWLRDFDASGSHRRTLLRLLPLALTPVALWAAVLVYFAMTGRLGLFLTVVVFFNAWYAGDIARNLAAAIAPSHLWPVFLSSQAPLLVVGTGLLAQVRGQMRRHLPLLAYAAAAVLMVAVQGRESRHNYQLYLPPLVLAAAWALEGIDAPAVRWRRVLAASLTVGLIGVLLTLHIRDLRYDADAASTRKFGNACIVVRETAKVIDMIITPSEQMFVWGIDPGFYFHTGHRPITSCLWSTHLRGPLTDLLKDRLEHDLRRQPPDLLVVDTRADLGRLSPALQTWLRSGYDPIPTKAEFTPFRLLSRRGSDLDRRIAKAVAEAQRQ